MDYRHLCVSFVGLCVESRVRFCQIDQLLLYIVLIAIAALAKVISRYLSARKNAFERSAPRVYGEKQKPNVNTCGVSRRLNVTAIKQHYGVFALFLSVEISLRSVSVKLSSCRLLQVHEKVFQFTSVKKCNQHNITVKTQEKSFVLKISV